LEFSDTGYLKVNKNLETNIKGIYGSGDVIGDPLYVYTAAYEGNIAAENAMGNKVEVDYNALGWVVFTDPQIAGIGIDEKEAKEKGINIDISMIPLSYIPRSIAARNTKGFIKLFRDKNTHNILGARILAHEGSELLMEIAIAIKWKLKSEDLANMFHPYLTLSEGIKLAALSFNQDISKLSCCAT